MNEVDSLYSCRICEKTLPEKSALLEHLRLDHDLLEIASYAATTMAQEQDRDRIATQFHQRFQNLKKELVGS